jgi:hypothetical protein
MFLTFRDRHQLKTRPTWSLHDDRALSLLLLGSGGLFVMSALSAGSTR